MILTKTVFTQWNPKNKKWYEDKKYIFTKWKEEFEVRVEDLQDWSRILIDVQCDGCGEILKNITWANYKRYVKEDEKYYCNRCAYELFGKEKITKIRLDKSKSFYQWCIENNRQDVLDRWDYDLNKLKPSEISYRSQGENFKGYWFKCLDNPEHISERKNIANFVVRKNGNIDCYQCNAIAVTNPELVKHLVNKEDALNYSVGTAEKLLMKCPDCGYEKPITPRRFIKSGLSCPKCSDGFYSEKFLFSVFEQLNLEFKTQLSKITFEWCGDYKYDNYITKINGIVETHGLQHYKENKNWITSLNETQKNDKSKEQLAKVNGIKNYIILDCRKSEMKWIKNSIMNSKLPILLNFKEDDIDWLKCHEFACSSFVKKSCDLWSSGITSTLGIANELKLNRGTVTNYLKQGVILGWCNYNPKEKQKANGILQGGQGSKKVVCLTTGEVFNSLAEASREYNVNNISACCNNKLDFAGKHPITNEKLLWSYCD